MPPAPIKKTLYEILGVAANASAAEIKAAHDARLERAGAGNSDHDRAARVALSEAFGVLSNAPRRAAYDARLNSLAAEPVAATAARPASGPGRVRWVVAALIGLAIVAWFVTRHRAPPAPTIQMTPPVLLPSAPVEVATEAAAVAPAPRASAAGAVDLSPEQLYASASPSVVRVSSVKRDGTGSTLGSGVVLGTDTVITNCHVALTGDTVEVRDRERVMAAVVTVADEVYDLCKLRVGGLTAPAIALHAATPLKVGQRVYAIGSPQGLDLTLSEGLVSALREGPSGTYIQTTAPVSPGSSGGGLFDQQGKLIGIVTFQMRAGQNLNFAIPVEWLDRMATRKREPEREAAAALPQPTFGAQYRNAIWLGAWRCFGPLTGRGLEIVFDAAGTFTSKLDGKEGSGHYSMTKTTLTMSDSQRGSVFAIEEISAKRMVLNRGQGQRLVCDR